MSKNKNRGFSLLEILIYIAIIAVVTSIIGGVFLNFAKGKARAETRTEVDSNIQFVLNKIHRSVLAASEVITPAAAGDTSESLVLTISGTTVTYCVVNNQVYRSSGAACDENADLITSDTVTIDNLTFTRLENTNPVLAKTVVNIRTSLTSSYNSTSPDYQYTSTKQITSSLR